jgi:hypothetical protein
LIAHAAVLPLTGKGSASWPLATFASIIYRQTSMSDCSHAAALVDFFNWTQSTSAERIVNRQSYVLATSVDVLKTRSLLSIRGFTCDGEPVSAWQLCISPEGQMCNDSGSCVNGVCVCNAGRTGTYCEELVSSSESSDATIILGTSHSMQPSARV